jgi:5-methylcytosine-specific restriction protein A
MSIAVFRRMPTAARRPCQHAGCPELTDAQYCVIHAEAARQQKECWRGSSPEGGFTQRGNGYVPPTVASIPVCRISEVGSVTAVDDVDHIAPFKGLDDPLRLDAKNLQSLCRPHHNVKTSTQ